MIIDKKELTEIIETVVHSTIKALEEKNLLGTAKRKDKAERTKPNTYQRTEQLLYNYNGFKKVIAERMAEISDIRKYGVPVKGGAVVQYSAGGNRVPGLVLDEERVEAAVRQIEGSVQDTVQAVALIDKCMGALKNDPYYRILEMRYFEGRTQEDIAVELKCAQSTISSHRTRLVKELAMRIFPDQVVNEYLTV